MKNTLSYFVAAAFLVTSQASDVHAAVVSTTGAFTIVSPAPFDVTLNAYQSNTKIFVFAEVQSSTLGSDLPVDFGGTGGVIPAGTVINSHFVHQDTSGGTVTLSGTATFDGIILGIVASNANLDSSDSILGLAGTNYPTGLNSRGTATGDEAIDDSLSYAGHTLTLSSVTTTRVDQLRVITAIPGVPLSTAMRVCLAGLLGLTGIATSRKAVRSRGSSARFE